ncbi:hypothetical protein, partial [Sphingorhabdus sp.]|uniref:hypothetical protein n=1 Tax=Sphingorhabdus sp. TaxID=1902408 RepID=UPI003BAF475E
GLVDSRQHYRDGYAAILTPFGGALDDEVSIERESRVSTLGSLNSLEEFRGDNTKLSAKPTTAPEIRKKE